MTEQELKDGIGDGRIANQVHMFWTDEVITKAKRQKLCPTVQKLAWKLYVAAVEDKPMPNGHNVKLL
jgi:hypothetical protein